MSQDAPLLTPRFSSAIFVDVLEMQQGVTDKYLTLGSQTARRVRPARARSRGREAGRRGLGIGSENGQSDKSGSNVSDLGSKGCGVGGYLLRALMTPPQKGNPERGPQREKSISESN